eukprot:CAMPEP_0172468680 /NCGR_PEP_ID=MMETSP1065-20121228/61850_1 /TAXON_ID=265537 /ORGANISM="Amphiprora paludosa, Strain CCMP125" /LENGTH=38 /DNA_ID= /DNA_START= /DNA_END= /DNA_ORIENTATION=
MDVSALPLGTMVEVRRPAQDDEGKLAAGVVLGVEDEVE